MKKYITALMCVMVTASCFGQETNHLAKWRESSKARPASKEAEAKVGVWTQDFDAAKKLAQEKDLPLFLNFTGSDWCGWCMLMDKQVFSMAEWKNYAKSNLVLVTIDFPQNKSLVPVKYVERNQELKSTYKVKGYPTYILLASDGEKVLGRLGASEKATPKTFIPSVKKLTDEAKTETPKSETPKVETKM